MIDSATRMLQGFPQGGPVMCFGQPTMMEALTATARFQAGMHVFCRLDCVESGPSGIDCPVVCALRAS